MLTLVIVLPLLFGTTACAWAGARFGKRAAALPEIGGLAPVVERARKDYEFGDVQKLAVTPTVPHRPGSLP